MPTVTPIDSEHIGVVGGNIGFQVAQREGQTLVNQFVAGVYDEVYVIYSKFVSMAKQIPTIKQLSAYPADRNRGRSR